MNDNLIPLKKLNPFGRFCCTIGNLPTSYMLSLTYEEQLWWFCDFLENTVIPTINNNASAVEEVQELFVQLKSYVDNYFNNLNVQDEINNKLDEMAESGELTNLLLTYLNLSNNLKLNNIKWIAHRGASFEAPENTLPAWQWAKNQYFDGIEVDIQASSDGSLFCFHDDTVDRMTNGSGRFVEKSSADIQELLIDNGTNISYYPNLYISTFGEFLRFCKSENIFPFIEIKFDNTLTNINNFLNTLAQNGFLYKCIIISFNTSILEIIKEINPRIQCHALLELSQTNVDYCISKNMGIDFRYHDGLENQFGLDLIRHAHINNIEVSCWNYTYFNQEKPIYWNVDYITCDKVMNINNGGFINRYKSDTFVNGFKSLNKYVTQLLASNDIVPYINDVSKINLYDNKFTPHLQNNNYRAFCPQKIFLKNGSTLYFNCPEGYKFAYIIFDEDENELHDSGWQNVASYICNIQNAKFAILVFKKDDNSEMNHVDFDNLRKVFQGVDY